jgi:Glycosyltransferase WbsX
MNLEQEQVLTVAQTTQKNLQERKARAIAFYLPQFHPIPENDEWWGKGFTEWTNVTKAKPLFPGHYQPKLPADLGFYDLRIPEVRIAQAELAREYGIEGFCYWHYWFGNGKRILERPFNEVLKSGEPNFPFCLGWANESWTGIWHGSPNRILVEQTYPGLEDHEKHFYTLLEAFHDDRYIKIDGKPVFVIYKPKKLPESQKFTDLWRELAQRAGLKGIYFVAILNNEALWNPKKYGFDAITVSNQSKIMRNISNLQKDLKEIKVSFKKTIKNFINQKNADASLILYQSRLLFSNSKDNWLKLSRQKLGQPIHVYDYGEAIKYFLEEAPPEITSFPCVIPNWDNTPRSGLNGLVLHGSTPELFQVHLRQAIQKVIDKPFEERIIFVKSWNEWAEGNYLEPDRKYGKAYLEALRAEICN